MVQGARKALKMRSRNPTKINKNPSLDPKVSFVYPQVSLDRPHGPQGAKVEAPGLPNEKLGPKKNMSIFKRTAMVIKSSTFHQRNLENNYLDTNTKKDNYFYSPLCQPCMSCQSKSAGKPTSKPVRKPASRPASCKSASKQPASPQPSKGAGGRGEALRSAAVRSAPIARVFGTRVKCKNSTNVS